MSNSIHTTRRAPSALVALTALVAVAAACGRGPDSAVQAPPPPEVGVVTLESERVPLETEMPGRTMARLVAEVRPQVNGLLVDRLFEEGADVRAGQLLYRIDDAPYRAAVEQASAALAQAEAAVPAARARAERLRSLADDRAVGEQDADDAAAALSVAEANVAAARAALEAAQIQLQRAPIRSPISGRSGRSSVTVGALVTAHQPAPLVVIQQLDPIHVDVTRSSTELLRLRRALADGTLHRDADGGSSVRLLLEDGTPYAHPGTLQFQDVSVDPATGAVSLRLLFPNPDNVLLPGMFVRAVLEEGVVDAAVLAPQQGVTRDSRGNAVALVVGEGNTVEHRELELGRAIGDRWLVLSGLTAGDRLIVEGMQRVRPGSTVTPVDISAAPVSGGN